jgi:hypothetical protein
MNIHERFKKIDSLDKDKKRDDLVKNSAANNDMMDRHGIPPKETTGEFLSPAWPQKGKIDFGGSCDGEALEMVDHPKHYGGKEDSYEAINVIEAWDLDFHCGSVVKYIARHKKKGHPRQDIEKAIWYLQRYLDECLNG